MTKTNATFTVPRPLTEWEMDDVRIAIKNIMESKSFFYAGDDNIGDDIRLFLVDHPVDTNLELVEDAIQAS